MSVILIISPEPWHGHFVSKHHYAVKLAGRGATVLFLNPPDKSLQQPHIEQIKDYKNLYCISAPTVARGLRYYPGWLRRWIEQRWLEGLEKTINQEISTIWLFENSRFFDMRFAGKRLKIYHQVDSNQNFQIAMAASTADICFCVTDFIEQRLLPFNTFTYKIQHGVSIPDKTYDLPHEQAGKFADGTTHIAYIGNLDIVYLDVPLLSNLLRDFPDTCFHFVGNYSIDGALYQACEGASNVIWWGQVDSSSIPGILQNCDVLLVIYLADKYREQVANTHKLMEYFVSGKTVVATYTDEYKDKRHLLEMVDDKDEFQQNLAKVISDLPNYNSPERQAERIEYAKQYSYENQLDKIAILLNKHGLDTDKINWRGLHEK